MSGERLFKKSPSLSSGKRITTQEKAKVVLELRKEHKLAILLQISGLKRSTYYYWENNFKKPNVDTGLHTLIHSIYDEHEGRYGYHRVVMN